jgi:hypothetical protein
VTAPSASAVKILRAKERIELFRIILTKVAAPRRKKKGYMTY